jgi:hypothetical protein
MRTPLIFTLAALVAAPALADDMEKMKGESRQAAMGFAKQLGGELKKEMDSKGPDSAIDVCKTVAPAIASDLSRKNGWKVSRVSLKARNPVLGTPDAFEQKVLADFDARVAKGEKAETLEHAEIVTEPQGKFFRYLKAMPTQELCLNCHGTSEKVADVVKAKLKGEYPHDKATGYGVGQVRGAITVKRPL